MIYKTIENKSLVFDVGANIGARTQMFLDLGVEKVIAIEPQKACLDVLYQKFGSDKRVEIIPFALSDSEKNVTIQIANENTISSMSQEFIDTTSKRRFSGYKWESLESISTTTLDRLIALFGTPDFVKIDVEGYEHTVLQGLTKPLPMISIEYTPELHHLSIKCMEHLDNITEGYEYNYSHGESLEYALPSFVTRQEVDSYLRENVIGKTDFNGNLLFGDIYIKRK
jgi:FkbM family methyltransferase